MTQFSCDELANGQAGRALL